MADVSKLRANINGVFETFGVKDKIARENAENLSNVLSAAQIVDSASGAIASFSDGADDIPVRSLSVDLEPIQDLHGYDYPWPAGGGKNKFQTTATTSTKNGLTCTVNADGTATVSGTATATTDIVLGKFDFDGSTTYMLSGCPANGGSATYMLWVIGYIGLADTGAGKVQSSVSGTGKTVAIRVIEGVTVSNLLFKPMLCLSTESNPTEWSPYENLCPISGRDEVSVVRTGKNIFNAYNWDIDSDAASILVVDGINAMTVATAPYLERKNRYILPNTSSSYAVRFHIETMESASSGLSFSLSGVKKDGTTKALKRIICGAVGTTADIDVAIPSEYVGIAFGNWAYSGRVKVTNIQIEFGSTVSDYEAYQGQQVTLQLGQTVYGGKAEIISGSGESTYGMVDLGTLSWQTNMSGNSTIEVASRDLASVKAKGITNLVCNMLPTLNQSSATDDGRFGIRGFASGGGVAVKMPKTVVSSTEEAIAWIQSNHPMMCYELATPQTLALTPASLSTLKGQNNVWSDADSVDVTYIADPKLYIDKKIAEAISP